MRPRRPRGDILSPAFFNAALESVLRRWKARLHSRGLLLDSAHDMLTNIRYADDLMLSAKSCTVCFMIDVLSVELAQVGLHSNASNITLLRVIPILSFGRIGEIYEYVKI